MRRGSRGFLLFFEEAWVGEEAVVAVNVVVAYCSDRNRVMQSALLHPFSASDARRNVWLPPLDLRAS